jgi:hypothetical protein
LKPLSSCGRAKAQHWLKDRAGWLAATVRSLI